MSGLLLAVGGNVGWSTKRGIGALVGSGELPCVTSARWSPNCSGRGASKVDATIIHYTAGPTLSGAVDWLCNREAKASAHFVVGRGGEIAQLVHLADSAWHVGSASLGNMRTIGIELVNPGIVYQAGDGWVFRIGEKSYPWRGEAPEYRGLKFPGGRRVDAYWVPYTSAQIGALKRLIVDLERTEYEPATLDIRGHEDVATPEGRKTDPGPLFPWEIFAGRSRSRKTTVV